MVTFNKIVRRITETRWSKLYISMALLQCIFIITLQASICSQNTLQANLLPDIGNDSSLLLSTTSSADTIPIRAKDRLGRIKWENIAFMGFQAWFFGMAVDATVYQNTAEILVLAVLNCFCAMLGALEVVDGVKWLNQLQQTQYPVWPLANAEKMEIALAVVILAFAIVMSYLSYEMSKQFGWNIYKKIGADVRIQKMYRIFQFFVLALKIDIFTEFLISIFYLIQFAVKENGTQWDTWIQLAVTILMLPMLYFARTAGSTESEGRMITFVCFQAIVIIHFALVLDQTFQPNNNWYTWITFVWIGIAVDVATMVLGILAMRNFDQGLKPYVQRGDKNKQKHHDLELNKTSTTDTWQIDD
ncbi:threonine deaminase [Mucor velutinosus]|uniref:Threonine deaminase n=1 Tax=Mucor velutinosus TaxID=708070 RepID=A0AAN7DS02_9FUNG|nr:threonine deaminase [Mucor velutinosus]